MDLLPLEKVVLNETSQALVKDAEETARRVDAFRPLPPEVVRRIEDELLGERVFSSNAIEGNTLDLRETVMILKQGIMGARKRREALEARNLGEAARLIGQWAMDGHPCHTTENLLRVHGVILREIDDHWAGRWRQHRVMIDGAKYQPPNDREIPTLVEALTAQLSSPLPVSAAVRAAWGHWAIARIHPFHDGNGRISRLWQDLILLQGGLTCAVIRPEERRAYLDALAKADEGSFDALVQLVAQRITLTFDRYLIEIGRARELDSWLKEVVGEADARVTDAKRLAYLRWSRKMEHLRSEFELCANRIAEASGEIQVQLRRQDLIDESRWENLRSGLKDGCTRFFDVDFSSKGRRWRYFFYFGRHFWSNLDDERDRSEQRVCLLVSEDRGPGTGEAVALYQLNQHPVTLREIFVVDDQFIRRRVEPGPDGGGYVHDRNITPLEIAQDFFREVILNRLT